MLRSPFVAFKVEGLQRIYYTREHADMASIVLDLVREAERLERPRWDHVAGLVEGLWLLAEKAKKQKGGQRLRYR